MIIYMHNKIYKGGKNMTETETIVAGGVIGGIYAAFGIAVILFYILLIIAEWKIFTKAGEEGWKSLIPVYNLYIMFKIAKMHAGWFWATLAISFLSVLFTADWFLIICVIITLMIDIMYVSKLADAFGKGIGFKIGLFFLPNIFTLILAFGEAEYQE